MWQDGWRVNGGKIMAEKFIPYDPAAALDSAEAIEVFLVDAFETNDAAHIAAAFSDVARAKGMNALAEHTGLSCDQLNRSLSENGNPSLRTTLDILNAVGLRLTVVPTSVDSGEVLSAVPNVGNDSDWDVRNG
jgi:probable addiction module antidote protein